ncbi:hypothetical protein PPTG_18198 [Phytophthora nicotianae INRA-310]|uniref:Uncharacterized protein n=3 Tax=Phytophthora nicotianae TaxID=4792 RepID=W2PH39_PHYN3|nr:hypothetical protein PPTG_18198 [Phytophthora nicotianae INRA-310]ETI29994.1 hypothetical protein F443_22889 [Phytophthora nicotianae P1569]ETM40322.1 hypothetical protein L914_13701 [Phytophthora nicotianae]ETN00197.1 hypothetical protein PPTG_18198 [Phytophthora nicotianae INRA-310]
MLSWFERWRGVRGKGVTVTYTVTEESLDNAWTAFEDRWNFETGSGFRKTIVAREVTHERMSVGRLASRLCELAWAADRHCCYVHYLEGCPKCRGFSLPRPYEGEWRRYVKDHPLSDDEKHLIGCYRQRLY